MGELLDALNALLGRWTRQAPLQALAVAFLVGYRYGGGDNAT
jgi:hypothetical protein